tara:strand:+ start:9358 stop:9792 length:435 start_codon:yes stop_codon:yes gene_type:complete
MIRYNLQVTYPTRVDDISRMEFAESMSALSYAIRDHSDSPYRIQRFDAGSGNAILAGRLAVVRVYGENGIETETVYATEALARSAIALLVDSDGYDLIQRLAGEDSVIVEHQMPLWLGTAANEYSTVYEAVIVNELGRTDTDRI